MGGCGRGVIERQDIANLEELRFCRVRELGHVWTGIEQPDFLTMRWTRDDDVRNARPAHVHHFDYRVLYRQGP